MFFPQFLFPPSTRTRRVWRRLPLCSSITRCIPRWNSIYVKLHDKRPRLLLSKCSVTLMYGFVWCAACDSRIARVNEYLLWSEQTHRFCYNCWSCMADVCLSFLLSFFLPPSLLQAFCKANYFSAHVDWGRFSAGVVLTPWILRGCEASFTFRTAKLK